MDRNRHLRHDGRNNEQVCEHAFKASTSSPRALTISSMISGGALERDAMDLSWWEGETSRSVGKIRRALQLTDGTYYDKMSWASRGISLSRFVQMDGVREELEGIPTWDTCSVVEMSECLDYSTLSVFILVMK